MFPAASPDLDIPRAPTLTVSRQRLLAVALILVYGAMQVALFITHEAWRDEAQAWLWAGALSSPREFFIVPGEGHPPLWFWLLRGLSSIVSFDQARTLTVATAILNAWLLSRVLRDDLVLLAAMLASNILLQYWGYQFRPYNLVFTTLLCALLLDQHKRPVAAAWVLALSCGLHLFSGLLFAMWMLVLLHRRTPLRLLVGPALLAAAFGAMAVLSALGNPAGEIKTGGELARRALNVLAWPVPPGSPAGAVAVAVIATLAYALRKTPFLLISALSLTFAFTAFAAMVYGASEWHLAYLLMLAFMAVTLAGPKATRWVLPVLLVPQIVTGLSVAWTQLTTPVVAESAVYAAVLADAGPGLDTETSLIAYPDYALSASAARHGFTYRSGMDGSMMGPVRWNTRGSLDPALAETPTPFWLVCMSCQPVLDTLAAAGLTATPLARGIDADQRAVIGYRIDAGI